MSGPLEDPTRIQTPVGVYILVINCDSMALCVFCAQKLWIMTSQRILVMAGR